MKAKDFDIVDFHAHILPNADHGSSSLDMSLAQLELAARHGIKHVVATPHFYPERHSVDEFITRRDQAYRELMDAVSADHPSVTLGAEVLICDGIERLERLDELCVFGTKILLLELPFSVFKPEYRDSVRRLIKLGYGVVLAHVDRYSPDTIETLAEEGVFMQLNAHALCGAGVPGDIKRWILSGQVVALGSDIHQVDKKAYKRFDKAKKRFISLGATADLQSFSDFICQC